MKAPKIALLIILAFCLADCHRLLIWSPERIKAYTTSNPGQPYRALGQVSGTHVPTGYYYVRTVPLQNIEINQEKYGDTKARKWTVQEKVAPKLSPDYQGANRIMLSNAYKAYGEIAGAVINVKYTTRVEVYDQNGVYDHYRQMMLTTATGTAVCFLDKYKQCIDFSKATTSQDEPQVQAEKPKQEQKVEYRKNPFQGIPQVILGQKLISAKTDNKYANGTEGYKSAVLYKYNTFQIRLISFESPDTARTFSYIRSQTLNASIHYNSFIWQKESCQYCSYLLYIIAYAQVVMIYPKDGKIDTAFKIANVLS